MSSVETKDLTWIERIQQYTPSKYWKRRRIVLNNKSNVLWLLKHYFWYNIKKSDAFNNCTLGTQMGYGVTFETVPYFLHGLYGLVILHNASVGKNSTIYHQITIGEGGEIK